MYQKAPISERVARIRQKYRTTKPKLDPHRYRLVTEFYMNNPDLTGILKRAYNLANLFENMPTPIHEDELIVGYPGETFRSSPMFPENHFQWMKTELDDIDTRDVDPYDVDDDLRAYIKENSQITIGIIAATNKQLKTFSEWLTTDGIPFEQVKKNSTFSMAKPGVKVVTAFGAKGLEFNCVIIPMFAEGYFPYNYQSDDQEDMEEFIIKMRNIVYVSMTRAKNLLTITFWGDGGSRFIADMDPSLYDWVGEPLVPSKKTNFSVRKDVVASTSVRPVIKTESEKNSSDDLAAFLKSKGVEIIDNRGKNGPLWAVGDKSIGTILNGEARSRYGALWTFCERGGFATRHRPAWFTKSKN